MLADAIHDVIGIGIVLVVWVVLGSVVVGLLNLAKALVRSAPVPRRITMESGIHLDAADVERGQEWASALRLVPPRHAPEVALPPPVARRSA